jgi:hypothetical protein
MSDKVILTDSVEDILKSHFVGKVIWDLEFGTRTGERWKAIGRRIVRIELGVNFDGDRGTFVYVEGMDFGDEGIFVRGNESIYVEY